MAEELLTGGNSNRVVRVGETVRRRTGPHSPAVHRLLVHLRERGFARAPRFLGIDERGREILGYLPGEAGAYPMPASVRSDRAMRATAAMMRDFHDATVDLVGLDLPWAWSARAGTEPTVICHYDLAPYNVVYDGTEPVGMIDFDAAGPGRRVDDIAYFAYRFAPLVADSNFSDGGWDAGIDRFDRLRQILDVYPTDERLLIPDIVIERLTGMRQWILDRAAAGDEAVRVHIREDHAGVYARDIAWVEENRGRLVAALGG